MKIVDNQELNFSIQKEKYRKIEFKNIDGNNQNPNLLAKPSRSIYDLVEKEIKDKIISNSNLDVLKMFKKNEEEKLKSCKLKK